MISKIFHFIWINFKEKDVNQEVPLKYQENILKWQQLHKDWSILVWNDSESNQFLKKMEPEWYSFSFVKPIFKTDVLRLLLLKHFGGVYVDVDCSPGMVSIDTLLENQSLIVLSGLNNWFLASEKNHPFLDHYLNRTKRRLRGIFHQGWNHFGVLFCTGPLALRASVSDYDQPITKLHKTDLDAFQIRHGADGSWSNPSFYIYDALVIGVILLFLLFLFRY